MEYLMSVPLQLGAFSQAQAWFYMGKHPQTKANAPSTEDLRNYPVRICVCTLERVRS